MIDHPSRRGLLAGAAALGLAAPGISWAFERDGNRKVLVFSGNQQVRCWTRMCVMIGQRA